MSDKDESPFIELPLVELTIEEQIEHAWTEHEDQLIAAFVPEAEFCSREEALALAYARNYAAAQELEEDCSALNLESEAKLHHEENPAVAEILHTLGYDY